jgi:transposase
VVPACERVRWRSFVAKSRREAGGCVFTVGVDPHKQTHTAVAVRAGSGELLEERTELALLAGFRALLEWGRELDVERVWALEDCRGVSRGFERFLRVCGERVVRVAPRLMAVRRRSSRRPGKSDGIDALAVARARARRARSARLR